MRLFTALLILLISGIASLNSFAQREIYRKEAKTQIEENAKQFGIEENIRFAKSIKLAQEKGIKRVDEIGDKKIYLQYINDIGEAMYLGSESNSRSARITRTDQLYRFGSLGLALNGKSDTLAGKLAIWDGGGVMTSHQEFSNRIKLQESTLTPELHSTHVAGTMIASGVITTARGMAFGADLKVWDYNNDNSEISTASTDLLISNHSYGYQAGWVYDSTKRKWQWWGNDTINSLEDYKFGFYDNNAQSLDRIAYNAPYYLMTKSAGNSRSENGPDFAKGEYYLLRNSRDSSNIIRTKNDAYDIISTTGTAKNILTVGAIESIQQTPSQPSELRVSSFTSWGPTDDGRIKPDIMGVGTDVLSTSNTSNAAYSSLNGTSMASPQVAGSLFLLQQLYNRLNNGRFMRSATIKGLVIHTAMDFGPIGPDYQSGWGLLDAENAAKLIQNKDKTQAIRELSLNNGNIYTEKFIASGVGNISATIAWTDPEGNVLPLVSSSLNNRSPRLINDLDIKIQDSKGSYLPFTLNPENPSALAKPGVNNLDNIEKIHIAQTVPGETYTLSINHKGTLKTGQQDYSLILSGIGGTSYCNASPTTRKTLISRLSADKFIVTNTLDSSGLALPLELGEKKMLTLQFSTPETKNIRAAVDWNQDGDFDDIGELIQTETNILGNSYALAVTPPSQTQIDRRYKLRILASNDLINSSCGSFTSGTSFEASIQMVQASNDVAVTGITSSTGNFCQNSGAITLLARLKNVGSKIQVKIPVQIAIYSNAQFITQLKGSIEKINAGSEQEVALEGNVSLEAGKTYTFELSHQLAGDQFTPNNLFQTQQTIQNPKAPIADGTQCTPGTLVNLTSASEGALWYANNELVGTGTRISLPATATYSIAEADFSAKLKPSNKSAFGSGNYFNNFGPEPIIEVKSPIILESARIYVGTSGTITFSVYNKETGELVGTVTKNVEATRTQSNQTRVNNQLIDDKNDPGQVVFLNLPFPKAGTYLLAQTCSNGASIFRSNRTLSDTLNNTTNIGYPYVISNILSITGANFNGSPIMSAYYYFYDMSFRSIGCPTPRSQVAVRRSVSPSINITPSGTLSTCTNEKKVIEANYSDNTSIQWLLNGMPIAGATQASFTANKPGEYQALVSNMSNCTSLSTSFKLAYTSPIIPTISYTNGVLKSPLGSNPQWLFNDIIIPGANGGELLPTSSGNYTVKVTDSNGCSAISDSYAISILANEEVNPFKQITAFPNPTQDEIVLGLPDSYSPEMEISVQIINSIGQCVHEQKHVSRTKKIRIDVRSLPTGQYIIAFPGKPTQVGIKFIKF